MLELVIFLAEGKISRRYKLVDWGGRDREGKKWNITEKGEKEGGGGGKEILASLTRLTDWRLYVAVMDGSCWLIS